MPFKPSCDSHFIINELYAVGRLEEAFGRLRSFVPLDGWSLSYQAVLHISNFLSGAERPRVLEYGSGAATAWLAKLVDSLEGTLISIEHCEFYFAQISELLKSEELSRFVDYRLCPLVEVTLPEVTRDIGSSSSSLWYDVSGLSPNAVDVVIIDGPPSGDNSIARLPAFDHIFNWLKSRALVVVDDVDREVELRLADEIAISAAERGWAVRRDALANTAFVYLS